MGDQKNIATPAGLPSGANPPVGVSVTASPMGQSGVLPSAGVQKQKSSLLIYLFFVLSLGLFLVMTFFVLSRLSFLNL